MTSARALYALAAALAVLVGGCGAEVPDNTGGPGLPQQRAGESYPGERRQILGQFIVADNGCFLLRLDGVSRVVIWPKDATSGGDAVVLADGTRLQDGDRVQGTGALLPVARLADWPGGYWGATVGFCDAAADRVVVLDSVVFQD